MTDRIKQSAAAWLRGRLGPSIVLLLLVAWIAGCGQSGPLVLPGELETAVPPGQPEESGEEDEDEG